MSERQPSTRLEHLDAASTQMLMNRYYSGENIQSLIAEFDVCCKPGELWRLFPPTPVTDRRCPVCEGQLELRRVSRSRLRLTVEPAHCSACSHIMSTSCHCDYCNDERTELAFREVANAKAAVINFCQDQQIFTRPPLEPEHLNAESAIALLTLVRCGGWIDETTIGALSGAAVLYAPKSIIDRLVTAYLITPRLIAPATTSSLDAFQVVDGAVVRWSVQGVRWRLLFEMPTRFIERLEGLMTEQCPENWKYGAEQLWRQLAVGECVEFCAYCLQQRRLPLPGALATQQLFDNLLRTYSVSQCFQIIWTGAREVADFLVRKQPNRQHASNYFVGACQRWADRALAEKWNVKGFRRNYDLPRSELSHVLHDVFFRHGELGFSGTIGMAGVA